MKQIDSYNTSTNADSVFSLDDLKKTALENIHETASMSNDLEPLNSITVPAQSLLIQPTSLPRRIMTVVLWIGVALAIFNIIVILVIISEVHNREKAIKTHQRSVMKLDAGTHHVVSDPPPDPYKDLKDYAASQKSVPPPPQENHTKKIVHQRRTIKKENKSLRRKRSLPSIDELINTSFRVHTVRSKKPSTKPSRVSRKTFDNIGFDRMQRQLNREQIKSAIRKVKFRVNFCYDLFRVPGLVKVKITVGKNERVISAKIKGVFAGTVTGNCVRNAIRSAKFPRFKGPNITFVYPFLFR